MPPVDFGLFFFDPTGRGADHAAHARQLVARAVGEREPVVHETGWHVLSGDLYGARNVQALMGKADLHPDWTRIDGALQRDFEEGHIPAFVPYVVGVFICPVGALRHGDSRLKEQRAAGYLGLATFVLPNLDLLHDISHALLLPITSLNPA